MIGRQVPPTRKVKGGWMLGPLVVMVPGGLLVWPGALTPTFVYMSSNSCWCSNDEWHALLQRVPAPVPKALVLITRSRAPTG